MKTDYTNGVIAMMVAMAFAGVGSAQPLRPVPAECASAFVSGVAADFGGDAGGLTELTGRMRDEQELLIDGVRALWPGIDADLISAGQRFETLRTCLSVDQWRTGVDLWAEALERVERVQRDSAYCGFSREARSLAQDGYLMFSPFISAAKGDDGMVPVAHLAAASGLLSAGIDLVTFPPNLLLSAGRAALGGVGRRRAASAKDRFLAFVESNACSRPEKT